MWKSENNFVELVPSSSFAWDQGIELMSSGCTQLTPLSSQSSHQSCLLVLGFVFVFLRLFIYRYVYINMHLSMHVPNVCGTCKGQKRVGVGITRSYEPLNVHVGAKFRSSVRAGST